MKLLYHVTFFLFCILYLPSFLIKRKAQDHFGERLGNVSVPQKRGKRLWLHAVSLGEALALGPLVEEIRKTFPEIELVFSTTTNTGRAMLKRIQKEDEIVFYFPLDFGPIVRKSLRAIQPDYFATMETEIWPNLITVMKEEGVPIFLLNGRISKKSFRKYWWIRWAIRAPLKHIDLLCMQSHEDKERVCQLGADPQKVHVVGNMKFDLSFPEAKRKEASLMRGELGIQNGDMLWVAGSTHPHEERSLLKIYNTLVQEHPRLHLLIAPRHPERSKEVSKLIQSLHRKSVLFSKHQRWEGGPESILILDTVGHLRSIYAAADVVFIGGSLVPRGGQNLLEPAFFAKPITFGPHMDNFRDIAELFLKEKAALQVQSEGELAVVTRTLLQDERNRQSLGRRAQELIRTQQGVVNRHLQHLKGFLAS